MKPEKEFIWMVKLLNSPYLSGGLFRKQETAYKIDFEKFVGASDNSKLFRDWINMLIKEGIIECVGKERKSVGNSFNVYVINEVLLKDRLMKSPLFNHVRIVIDDVTQRVI